jgi:hypothetical protein
MPYFFKYLRLTTKLTFPIHTYWYLLVAWVLIAERAVDVAEGESIFNVRHRHRSERIRHDVRILALGSGFKVRPGFWTFVFHVQVSVLLEVNALDLWMTCPLENKILIKVWKIFHFYKPTFVHFYVMFYSRVNLERSEKRYPVWNHSHNVELANTFYLNYLETY